jgi:tRNA modification GTPase
LLVVVADIDSSPDEVLCPIGELMRRRNWCLVLNKIDCTEAGQASAWMARARSRAPVVICTSAHTGEGVDRLKSHLNKVLFTSDERATKDMLALSSRQRAALQEALQAVEAALTWCRDTFKGNGADTELLALHLREGVHALSVLEGRITTDDLLDRVFSRFCVGK